jgi:hypothetical protein
MVMNDVLIKNMKLILIPSLSISFLLLFFILKGGRVTDDKVKPHYKYVI